MRRQDELTDAIRSSGAAAVEIYYLLRGAEVLVVAGGWVLGWLDLEQRTARGAGGQVGVGVECFSGHAHFFKRARYS
jgi:hypothetical protein